MVRSAPSATALEQQWRARSGTHLSPADLTRPQPQLRAQLLSQLQQLDNRVEASHNSGVRLARIWAVVQNTLRLCLSALFLALGFAAAAKGRHSAFTLLQVWQDSWFGDPQRLQRLRSRHAGRGRRGPDSPEVEDYFNAISPKDQDRVPTAEPKLPP